MKRGALTLDSNSRASVPASSTTTAGVTPNVRFGLLFDEGGSAGRIDAAPHLDRQAQHVELVAARSAPP